MATRDARHHREPDDAFDLSYGTAPTHLSPRLRLAYLLEHAGERFTERGLLYIGGMCLAACEELRSADADSSLARLQSFLDAGGTLADDAEAGS